jgi:antitoxin component YwqK of YwqJK toxin-antitoxin module
MRIMLRARILVPSLCAAVLVSLLAGACSTSSGQQETYWSDGTPKERWVEMESDAGRPVRHGTYESWYASGRIHERGEYVEGLKQSTWTEWYDHPSSTILTQGEYDAGERNGVWTYWHNPEHASLHGDSHLNHGEVDPTKVDMPVLKVAGYNHGAADGDWISWHASGQVADSMRYANGKLDGEVRVYDEEGNLVAVRSYERGKPTDSGRT